MKIDTEIIREVLYGVDTDAHTDPAFEQTIDLMIIKLERAQKKYTIRKQNKKGVRHED